MSAVEGGPDVSAVPMRGGEVPLSETTGLSRQYSFLDSFGTAKLIAPLPEFGGFWTRASRSQLVAERGKSLGADR